MPHETLPCTPPDAFSPLLEFLHSVTELALIVGLAIGMLGIVVGGLYIVAPTGQDGSERGKRIIKNTVVGMVLILSAQMVVAYLVSQLGGGMC